MLPGPVIWVTAMSPTARSTEQMQQEHRQHGRRGAGEDRGLTKNCVGLGRKGQRFFAVSQSFSTASKRNSCRCLRNKTELFCWRMKATDVSMEDSLLGTEGSLVALGELGSVSQTCKGQDKNVSVRPVRRKEVV